jgi:opacity protein-like surface antigen
MKLFRIFLFSVCFPLLSLSLTAGEAEDFRGFWISFGAEGQHSLVDTQTDFRYVNLFGGNVSDPRSTNLAGTYPLLQDDLPDILPKIELGYTEVLCDRITLGVAGAVDLSERKTTLFSPSFTFPGTQGDNPSGYLMSSDVIQTGHFSVILEPGYALTRRLLLFPSFSYHYLQAEIRTSSSFNAGVNPAGVIVNPTTHEVFSGFGVGGGIKYLFHKNWFVKTGAEWIFYETHKVAAPSLTSVPDEIFLTQTQIIDPSSLAVKILVGYQF